MMPSLMNIQVPDIDNCSYEQELEIVFDAYQNHQLNHCSKIYEGDDYKELIQIVETMDQDGRIHPWTIADGYRYFRNFDESIIFNHQGEIVNHIKSHVEPISANLPSQFNVSNVQQVRIKSLSQQVRTKIR